MSAPGRDGGTAGTHAAPSVAPAGPRPAPWRVALGAVLRLPQGKVALALLVAWLAYEGWLRAAAPGKIADGFPTEREKLNVLVTLPFPPERFHVLVFQRFGRVSGTDGHTVEVRGVPRTELARLARPYWVERVEPLKLAP